MNSLQRQVFATFTVLVFYFFPISELLAQGLDNGGVVLGQITQVGEQDTFSFEATQGETILISVAAINDARLEPELEIISPTNQSLSVTNGNNVGHVSLLIESTGVHQLLVRDSSFNNQSTGDYAVHFAGTESVDELGELTSGGVAVGDITIGDIDSYTFDAVAGEHIIIQAADLDTSFFIPRLLLYGPSGEFLAESALSNVSQITGLITASGIHRVLLLDQARSTSGPDAVGDYEIHFVKSTDANELGTLSNGGFVTDTITLGDIDSYTFSGLTGQTFLLNAVSLSNNILAFDPRIIVYDPNGNVIGDFNESLVTQLSLILETDGIYRVAILDTGGSAFGPDGGDDYEIHFAIAPTANEHGQVINGGFVSESITRGDIDSYVFEGEEGEALLINAVRTSGDLDPRLVLFGPAGNALIDQSSRGVSQISTKLDVTGTYTLVLLDNSRQAFGPGGTGGFEIHFAKVPGAIEHGFIPSGSTRSEQITRGDIDTYTFDANAGDNVFLSLAKVNSILSSFSTRLIIYDPVGNILTSVTNRDTNRFLGQVPLTGQYTIAVLESGFDGRTQDYDLHYLSTPGAVEHGQLVNGATLPVEENITRGDLDSYSFNAVEGGNVLIGIRFSDFGTSDLRFLVFDPSGALRLIDFDEFTFGGFFRNSHTFLNFTTEQTGSYTLVILDDSSDGESTFDYEIHFASTPGANELGLFTNGSQITERITPVDIDSFTFFGNVDDNISIQVSEIQGTDPDGISFLPVVILYDPTGARVTAAADNENVQIQSELTATGTYSVVIYNGREGLGTEDFEYTLSFSSDGVPPQPLLPDLFEDDDQFNAASQINIGVVQQHNIHESGDVDWVTFTLEEPDNVDIRAISSGDDGAPRITLVNQQQQEIQNSGDVVDQLEQANNQLSRIELELEPGSYGIRVEGFSPTGLIRNYRLELIGNSTNDDSFCVPIRTSNGSVALICL